MNMNDLLKALVEKKGSDLHLLVGRPPGIRLHGELVPMEEYGMMTPEGVKDVIYGVLTDEQKRRFESDDEMRYELDFAHSLHGMGRFRFNIHKQRGTFAAVARALASSIPPMEKLNLPQSVTKFTLAKKGLALVTGPTGSGKSTTLAAVINHINECRPDHILTIEDPIEYMHNSKKSYVTQREVGDSADTLSFKNALKYALRQDPDVILIGEMRDYETIGIAITSAETGHLVFGTLHTNSAAQTIGRIIDVFPGDQVEQVKTQLAGSLYGVLAQILLPRQDGKGRVCCCEVMFSNTAIKNNIRTNNIDAIYQSIQTGLKEGMQTMDMSIKGHVKSGAISYEMAKPYLRDESTHRELAEFAGPTGRPSEHSGGSGGNGGHQPLSGVAAGGAAEPQKRGGFGGVIPPWEKR